MSELSRFSEAFDSYTPPKNISTYGLCVPSTLLHCSTPFAIGAQDCHHEEQGAYTGDLSAKMIKEAGAEMVITGHSERRQYHHETSEHVAKKTLAAHNAGLFTIICVGEPLDIREAGDAETYVCNELKTSLPNTANAENTVIAYEPVWAIGTGKVATLEQIESMHRTLNNAVNLPILYGGSVKPENAHKILHTDKVSGVLVGGASLEAESFKKIIEAAA